MKTKYTKDYYKLWMMFAYALSLGTAGYLLSGEGTYKECLSVLGGVVAGTYIGHSFGIVIYYLCKWRYPNRVGENEDRQE